MPTGNVEHLRSRYDTILIEAGNPPRPRRSGTRGRIKQSPACNLIRRLREHRNEVLRFLGGAQESEGATFHSLSYAPL